MILLDFWNTNAMFFGEKGASLQKTAVSSIFSNILKRNYVERENFENSSTSFSSFDRSTSIRFSIFANLSLLYFFAQYE